MEPLRVLHVVPNMQAAGLETLIMNMYRNVDKTKVQFDFLVHYKERYFYDDEIESLGGKIYRLSFRNDGNVYRYIRDLDDFFRNHSYMIVHGHMASTACFYLKMANKYGVPVRIIHSHNTSTERTVKGFIKHELLKYSTLFANQNFACGIMAGKYLFGHRDFTIVHNAVDLERFKPDPLIGEQLKQKNGLDKSFVIGHIGRFNSQKNHKFLIDMFSKLVSKIPNAELLLVGEGELKETIVKQVNDLGLQARVHFLGIRSDTHAIYNMIDVLTLPSLFEGLPVVAIECQACGKKLLVSDSVTKEIAITDLVEYLPISSDSQEKWINKLYEIYSNRSYPQSTQHYNTVKKELRANGYDIKFESGRLVNIYKSLLEDKLGEK